MERMNDIRERIIKWHFKDIEMNRKEIENIKREIIRIRLIAVTVALAFTALVFVVV